MELQPILKHLARWGWLIALCAAVAGLAGLLASRVLTPVYKGTATLVVSRAAPGDAPVSEALQSAEAVAQTYAQLIARPSVHEALVSRLGLPLEPEALGRRLGAAPVVGTPLLTVSAEASDPAQAAALANAAASELVARGPQLLGATGRRAIVSVAEPAAPPERPVFPHVPLTVAIAALLGALAAGGALALRQSLLGLVETPEDVERGSGLEPLAVIPSYRRPAGETGLVAREQATPAGEAFRQLRAHLAPHIPSGGGWALAVAGATGGEGTGDVAANLAVAFAETGRPVILVDANLRRPGLHARFGLRGERGLTTALQRGAAPLAEHLSATSTPQLRLLAAGPATGSPGALLASRDLPALMARLRDEAELVIIDCGAALALADGLEAARACDAALLVARAGASRTGDLAQLRDHLERAGVPVVGAALCGGSRKAWRRAGGAAAGRRRDAGAEPEARPQAAGD